VPERLPSLDKAARNAHAAGLGKLLPEDLYLEKGLVARLPAALRAQVAKGEKIAGRRRYPYNLVKIGLDGKRVSFLSYPQLETAKLPELARTAAVRLDTKTVRVIDYSQRAKPPVLHRKELVMGKKCKANKNPQTGVPVGTIEKHIVQILLWGLQVSGKREWYPLEWLPGNFPKSREETIRQKAKSLESKGIVDIKGGKLRLSPDVEVQKKAKKKGKKNPKSVSAAEQATRQVLSQRNRLAASLSTTAKRRAFAAVDQRKTPMADGAIKVTFGGWGVKDGLTHRYNVRAKVDPKGGITLHWSNKSAKGKTAAKALDAAAKKGLLPNRSGAAKWRDARKAATRAAGKAKKNPALKQLPAAVLRAQKAAEKAARKADPKPAKKKAPKKLVFHAKTSGGKWDIKAWRVGRKYEATESGSSGSTARRIGYSKPGMTSALVDSIIGAKTWDGINYIIQLDELGIQAVLDKLKPKKKSKKSSVKLPSKVLAAAKAAAKAARKGARKNPATGLSRQTAQQAMIDLKQRGYTGVSTKRSDGLDQVEFAAWTKAKPYRRVKLIAVYTQPALRSDAIAVTVGALIGAKWDIIGTRKLTNAQSAVPIAGALASRRFSARKPTAAGSKAKRPGVLAGFFQNPAEEQKAWATVQKVFKQERAAMKRGFKDLFYTGLKPDKKVHDTERHYAMTGKNAKGEVWVHVSPALGLLPISKVRGVIRHELGHAAILHGYEPMVSGKTKTLAQYDRRERQADKVAEQLSGAKIYYDAKTIQASGPGASGTRIRPKGLR
jgi:hypothetical protein